MEDSRVTNRKKILVPLIVLAVLVALAAVAAGAYLGLCRWVQTNGRLLPGATAVDDSGAVVADLGGMAQADAVAEMAQAMDQKLQDRSLTVYYGDGQSASLSGGLLAYSPDAAVAGGMDAKAGVPFWKLGALWLGMVKEPTTMSVSTTAYSEEGAAEAKALSERISDEVYVAPVDYSIEMDEAEENVTVVKGTDGQEAVTDTLVDDILAALLSGRDELSVATRTIPCLEITADELNEQIYVEPQAPVKDEDGNMIPAVIGLSIDTASAQTALDGVGPGESCTISLVRTSPQIETPDPDPNSNVNPYAEGDFYHDKLATVTTHISGIANRVFNVTRAAKFCNGKVVNPGETFSYFGAIGHPNVANGYKTATGYKGGQTVPMDGGGVCQVSSCLYYCSVYANLKIVRRAAHAFATGYIANGLDATVYYPSLDYKFQNNTGYPLKIVTSVSGRTLTVSFYGTNPDGHYVKTEIKQLSQTPWTTVYKPDASVPRGTTQEDVTPYTGYEVDVYRLVYAKDGTLLSRTHENHSRYAKRDRVILYNPADSGPWGAGGTTTVPTTPPATQPPATEAPATEPPATQPPATQAPVVTDPPAVTTDPPVVPTDPPVVPTDPPVVSTDPPVVSTDPPAVPTDPPVAHTDPPAPPTAAPQPDPAPETGGEAAGEPAA